MIIKSGWIGFWILMFYCGSLILGFPLYGLVITLKDHTDPYASNMGVLTLVPILALGAGAVIIVVGGTLAILNRFFRLDPEPDIKNERFGPMYSS